MWEFLDIRQFAIEKLSNLNMTTVDKIIFAKEYKVSRWLKEAYQALAQRKKTISIDEARRLGLETTVRMFHVRDEVYYVNRYHYDDDRCSFDFSGWINIEFRDELKELEAADRAYTLKRVREI